MADWMIKSAALFKPLYDLLHQQLLAQAVINVDETTLKVINDERVTSYMWVVLLRCRWPNAAPRYQGLRNRNIVLYDNQDGSCAGSWSVIFWPPSKPCLGGINRWMVMRLTLKPAIT